MYLSKQECRLSSLQLRAPLGYSSSRPTLRKQLRGASTSYYASKLFPKLETPIFLHISHKRSHFYSGGRENESRLPSFIEAEEKLNGQVGWLILEKSGSNRQNKKKRPTQTRQYSRLLFSESYFMRNSVGIEIYLKALQTHLCLYTPRVSSQQDGAITVILPPSSNDYTTTLLTNFTHLGSTLKSSTDSWNLTSPLAKVTQMIVCCCFV